MRVRAPQPHQNGRGQRGITGKAAEPGGAARRPFAQVGAQAAVE